MTPTNCDPDRLLCAVRDLIEAVNGNPWPEFLLTVLATLVGAVVGAFVAWRFSIDLARRARAERVEELKQERLDRDQEREQASIKHQEEREADRRARRLEREQDREARSRERLDVAIAAVVERIGAWDAATSSWRFALAGMGSAETPHGARARLLGSIRVAQMYASKEEVGPLDATYEVMTARGGDGTDESRALDRQNAADTLAEWRRGLLDAPAAEQKIRFRPPPMPPETSST